MKSNGERYLLHFPALSQCFSHIPLQVEKSFCPFRLLLLALPLFKVLHSKVLDKTWLISFNMWYVFQLYITTCFLESIHFLCPLITRLRHLRRRSSFGGLPLLTSFYTLWGLYLVMWNEEYSYKSSKKKKSVAKFKFLPLPSNKL